MSRYRMALLCGPILLAGVGSALLGGYGCSGPQPLSVAIDRQDESDYRAALTTHGPSPRDAFFADKSARTGKSIGQVAAVDAGLSTTRNPFDAYRDPAAVSRGAVVYKMHCMTCHGEEARGHGPAMPVALPRMDFHDFSHRFTSTLHRGAPRSWFKKINEGYTSEVAGPDGSHPTMLAFKDVLAREQIWLAITYLQSLDMHAPASRDVSAE